VTILEVRGLSVQAGKKDLLSSLNLTFEAGSWSSIIGPNGAGKTTLVEALSGIRPVPADTVYIGGRDLTTMNERDRAQALSFVPQNPLVPKGMSVRSYIALGRTAHQGAWRSTSPRDREVIERVATRMNIVELLEREISSLSGGERQRAVLARALAQGSAVLVMDEPTSALDIGHQLQILSLLRREVEEQGACVVTTLHDLTLAGRGVDRLIVLNEGRIVIDGPARAALRDPQLSAVYGLRLEVLTIEGVEIVIPTSQ